MYMLYPIFVMFTAVGMETAI